MRQALRVHDEDAHVGVVLELALGHALEPAVLAAAAQQHELRAQLLATLGSRLHVST